MLYTIITTTNARRDIQDAIDWENMRQPGLAKRFLIDLEQKLLAIAAVPHIGSIRYENVHCVVTNTFQYLIHYTIDEDRQQIFILRVLHTSRKPVW
jgi:plasmid stabilization system protein ParE